jgi:hypothetical protein
VADENRWRAPFHAVGRCEKRGTTERAEAGVALAPAAETTLFALCTVGCIISHAPQFR